MQGMATFGSEGASLRDAVVLWPASSGSEWDIRARVSRRSAPPADEGKPLSVARRTSAAQKGGRV